jgi:hypothetical protein
MSSNPFSSSGESANSRYRSGRDQRAKVVRFALEHRFDLGGLRISGTSTIAPLVRRTARPRK